MTATPDDAEPAPATSNTAAPKVVDSYCSWTDLVGASAHLEGVTASEIGPAATQAIRRIARFHETVRSHAHYFAPALVVADGVAQVVSKGDKWWEHPRELVKRVGLMHYATCVEDSGPGARTTVCKGPSIVTGVDHESFHGGLSFRAASKRPADPDSEEWNRWYDANASTFGVVHYLAIKEFQLNLAFAKAWTCDAKLSDAPTRMFVEHDVLKDSLVDASEWELFESPTGVYLSHAKPTDNPDARIGMDDFMGAIRRAPDQSNRTVQTKVGAVDLVPVQARYFRYLKLSGKEWKNLRAKHGDDVLDSDPKFNYLEPEPLWK